MIPRLLLIISVSGPEEIQSYPKFYSLWIKDGLTIVTEVYQHTVQKGVNCLCTKDA